jgi:hypothetical protein
LVATGGSQERDVRIPFFQMLGPSSLHRKFKSIPLHRRKNTPDRRAIACGHTTCLKGGQITFQSMKAPNRLRTLSINLSLVILAFGFSALGLFSVMNRQPSLSTGMLSVEHAYSLIGSIFSVLVGATFLVAAITFRGMRTGSEGLASKIDAHLI